MEEKNAFYSRLYDMKEKLEETAIPGRGNTAEVFKERQGKWQVSIRGKR